MTIKLGILMDPIHSIHYKKDSTLAMLWEAQSRNWDIIYFEQKDLFYTAQEGKEGAYANVHTLTLFHDEKHYFELSGPRTLALAELDVILMRKDPPFNLEYIYTTYMLEHAEKAGVLVLNKPQSLRDANEKFFTTQFPTCCPPTLVTRDITLARAFFQEQGDIVCKPLDGMGGTSIFRLTYPDENASAIFETLTHRGDCTMVIQKYIPEIKKGDKRILLIDGEPIPYALARIPAEGELRGNLAAGGHGKVQPLTDRDRWICQQVAPILKEKGLFFVGLDVIGDYLTEINVTSPTCIREIDAQAGTNIGTIMMDALEKKLG